MDTQQIIAIIAASGLVAGIGLLVGLFLSLSGRLLKVPTNEKQAAVRACLPGNNCGGCGYSGCDACAKAIADGEAPANACPVGGAESAALVAEVMGVEAGAAVRRVAFIKCSGSCDRTEFIYEYFGDGDCHRVALAPGRGSKACAYGCTGLGSCAKACEFEAIRLVNGRAEVMPDRCRGCGRCVSVCPNHLIELIPADAACVVRCFSQEKGKTVREMCEAGCIGCGLCRKVCPSGAITVENNVAHIDQSKCTHCGLCAEKCPAKVIVVRQEERRGSVPDPA